MTSNEPLDVYPNFAEVAITRVKDTDILNIKVDGSPAPFRRDVEEIIYNFKAELSLDIAGSRITVRAGEEFSQGVPRSLYSDVASQIRAALINAVAESNQDPVIVLSGSHKPTTPAQSQVATTAQAVHAGNTDVTESSFHNPDSRRRSLASPARPGGTSGSKEPMSSSPKPYQSPGHCIRFPDKEERIRAIGLLRDTTEIYCGVAPDLFLFTNNQVEALEQAGVTFEYVSEPPSPSQP